MSVTLRDPAAPTAAVVGASVERVDGRALLRGEPVFTDDVHPDGMLWAKVLASQ